MKLPNFLFLLITTFLFFSCGENKTSSSDAINLEHASLSPSRNDVQPSITQHKAAEAAPTVVEESLGERIIECTCALKELAHEFRKEIDAGGDFNRNRLTAEAAQRMKDQDCMKELNEELDKLPENEKKKFKKEIKASIKMRCPRPMEVFKVK